MEQKKNIFLHFFKQLDDQGLVNEMEGANGLKMWLNRKNRNMDFNGRQIRNIVSAAMSIARAKGEKLRPDHLNRVAEETSAFNTRFQERFE